MEEAPSTGAGDRCLACGTALKPLGTQSFRVGGMVGGWKLFLDQWGELDEELLPFEVLVCPGCRRVEFRAPTTPP